jgi:hypothetical protein
VQFRPARLLILSGCSSEVERGKSCFSNFVVTFSILRRMPEELHCKLASEQLFAGSSPAVSIRRGVAEVENAPMSERTVRFSKTCRRYSVLLQRANAVSDYTISAKT